MFWAKSQTKGHLGSNFFRQGKIYIFSYFEVFRASYICFNLFFTSNYYFLEAIKKWRILSKKDFFGRTYVKIFSSRPKNFSQKYLVFRDSNQLLIVFLTPNLYFLKDIRKVPRLKTKVNLEQTRVKFFSSKSKKIFEDIIEIQNLKSS